LTVLSVQYDHYGAKVLLFLILSYTEGTARASHISCKP